MDSSFLTSGTADILTAVNLGLGIYSFFIFLKLIIQFGLPNHPARFTVYLVTFCVSLYFIGRVSVDLGLASPWLWLKWRVLPLVAGSLGLLLQTVMIVGQFSLIQQKVVSRLPVISALIVIAFFPTKADIFYGLCLLAAVVFLSVSVGKARYQKRLFFKMVLFIGFAFVLKATNVYVLFVLAECVFFLALFYFALFENSIGVSSLIDDRRESLEGESP